MPDRGAAAAAERRLEEALAHAVVRGGEPAALRDGGDVVDVGEILVVASKLKAYVKSVSGYSTSDRVLPVLSKALRKICDESIENARRAERQRVMDRDVPGG